MPIHEEPWPNGTPSLLSLACPNPRGTAEPYANLFGWQLEPMAGGVVARVLDRPVALFLPGDAGAQWTTHLVVDDVYVAMSTARVAGARMDDPIDTGEGLLVRGTDPAGADVGFWAPSDPATAVGELGTLLWSELLVRDVDAARTFYDVVLDVRHEEVDGEEWSTLHSRGGELVARIGVISDAGHADVPSHWLPFLDVTDLDEDDAIGEAWALASLYGFEPVDEPMEGDLGRLALVRGRAGEVVALLELYPEDD